jgi:hypothetical protein
MAYSQGGLIESKDYNNLIGTSPSSTVNTLNTVWAVGSGSAGYGQTAVTSVSSATLVTATQWASLINTLNSVLTHQSGSGSGITATTAGTTINYLSTLSSSVTTAYSNRLTFASNSAAIVGSAQTTTWTVASTSATQTRAFGIRAAFASADQARYFFNAGGRLKLNCSGALNGSSSARSTDIVNLLTYSGGIGLFAATTNAGRTGTSGTLNTNDTTKGYYTGTYNSNVTVVAVTTTNATYSADTATITVNMNGTQGTNNDMGTNVDFWITLNSTSGTNTGFDDDIGVNVVRSIDLSYPEATNLGNTWGTVTISSL